VRLSTNAAITGQVVDLRALRALNAEAVASCAQVNAPVHSEICVAPTRSLDAYKITDSPATDGTAS
jgi:hypothetical protein